MDNIQVRKELENYSFWLFKRWSPENATRREIFREQYILCLCNAFQDDPEYSYIRDRQKAFKDIERLADSMIDHLISGSASKDGAALKQTCKLLKIKHTYKAIREYLA